MIPQIKPLFGEQEAQAVYDLILSGSWLMEFTHTREFEKQIAEFVGVKHCSTVNNGTIGLILALKACGLGVGDKVACPALSMIATATAITMIGAVPVFVDIDTSGCMDIYNLKEKVDAVLYVSLNGRAGNIKDVKDYCDYRDIYLIEDACQSLGSDNLGTIGDIGVYSLSPHKIISTGQGGLVITNDNLLASRVVHLRDFGRTKGGVDEHRFFGINAKFTDLQSVIGLIQLKHLKDRISVKKHIYKQYELHLKDLIHEHHLTPWMVDIYCDNRDELAEFLKDNKIETRKMYPVIPHEDCYKELRSFPVAQQFSYNGLWLPSSVDLTGNEIDYICGKVKEFKKGR
jgi:perosamine synthetase